MITILSSDVFLQKEMRQHVVRFLVETEQSYVESLKIILKVSSAVDVNVII